MAWYDMIRSFAGMDAAEREKDITRGIAWICRYGKGVTLREILACDASWLRSFSAALGDIVERENRPGEQQ